MPGRTACLAHLGDTARDTYLASLAPGADIDLRGTPFTEPLLSSLLQAIRDPTTGKPHFGAARFDGAQFSGAAWFRQAQFSGDASFDKAVFSGAARFHGAWFDGAQFSGAARFGQAQFSGDASFDKAEFRDAEFGRAHFSRVARFVQAQFSGRAEFYGAQFHEARFDEAHFSGAARFAEAEFSYSHFAGAHFSGAAGFTEARFTRGAWFNGANFSRGTSFLSAQFHDAHFDEAQFSRHVWFGSSQFAGDAWFWGTQFSGDADFSKVQFSRGAVFRGSRFAAAAWFGPVVCAGTLVLSGAVFEAPVTMEIAADAVRCERTRWESTANLRLRYATVDLSHAVLSFPVAVTAHPARFVTKVLATEADESLMADSDSRVRVVSVSGLDAAHLVLADTDLSDCLFSGAFHLDQLRLEGRCTFARTPTGLHRRHLIWPYRWSRRRTLAEEHHWRAQTAGQPAPASGQAPSPRHWRTRPHHPDSDQTPVSEGVAALYRHLRKAFEDGKNEPGAADFYYGEMEMRRHDRTGTPPGERGLLWGYWLLSGYGLRASRALSWLLAAMAVTVLLVMGLGLPDSSPRQVATGTVPADGGRVTLAVDKQDPKLTLPVADRFTEERCDNALQVVLNSVVFRSSGQDLTTWGTYTEMVSRFTEPGLLALAILAMRGRIKR